MTQKVNFLTLLVVLFFGRVLSEGCPKYWGKCGENFCCCKGSKVAVCENKNLTYIPKLPKGVKSLKFIGNNIRNLSAESFVNLSASTIQFLGLLSNGIENVHNNTFAIFSKLNQLSLQNNKNLEWTQFQWALYSVQYSVKSLFLDNTGLRSLPDDIFDGLRNKNISFLTLRNNTIKLFNEKPFFHLQKLKTLDLSGNRIRKITLNNGTRLGHGSVERLSLAHNEIVYRPPWFCDAYSPNKTLYPRLKSLDLTGNAIIVLEREAWSCLKRLSKFLLAKNIIEILQDDLFVDLKSLAILHLSNMAKPFKKIEPKAFHNVNLRELHLDNNNIYFKPDSSVPYAKLFTFCPNIQTLLLSFNNFRAVYNTKLVTMLSPLKKLTTLHIEGARLYKIPGNVLNKFPNLTKLYLGLNKIEFINPEAFINVTTLRVLHIDNNKIKVIRDTFPVALQHSLKEINLAGNPFSCSFCASVNNTWFINWVKHSKIKFSNWPGYYACASPPCEHGTLLASHTPTEKDCKIKDLMFVAYATIGTFLVVFTVFGIMGYKGRWYIRYWTIKCRRKWNFGTKDDPERQRLLGGDFVYDVYVVYHDNDRGFVRDEILKLMEEEHNYRLFIWDRDFTAGDQTVGIVVDNIYKSNHVIAIISHSFLKDQWCDFQLAVSLDRQIELKRNFLTLITLEDFDKKLLSKSWCVILTKTATAEWCDKKTDIRRKLFEQQLFTNVPCGRCSGRHIQSVNSSIKD